MSKVEERSSVRLEWHPRQGMSALLDVIGEIGVRFELRKTSQLGEQAIIDLFAEHGLKIVPV